MCCKSLFFFFSFSKHIIVRSCDTNCPSIVVGRRVGLFHSVSRRESMTWRECVSDAHSTARSNAAGQPNVWCSYLVRKVLWSVFFYPSDGDQLGAVLVWIYQYYTNLFDWCHQVRFLKKDQEGNNSGIYDHQRRAKATAIGVFCKTLAIFQYVLFRIDDGMRGSGYAV